jgi:hypothetical protein
MEFGWSSIRHLAFILTAILLFLGSDVKKASWRENSVRKMYEGEDEVVFLHAMKAYVGMGYSSSLS